MGLLDGGGPWPEGAGDGPCDIPDFADTGILGTQWHLIGRFGSLGGGPLPPAAAQVKVPLLLSLIKSPCARSRGAKVCTLLNVGIGTENGAA